MAAYSFSKNVQQQPKPTLKAQLDSIFKVTDANNYVAAIDLIGQLIKDSEQQQNFTYLFHGYNLLSVSHANLRDTVQSLNYSKKALHYAQMSKNDTLISWAYNNLAADLSAHKESQAQALEYYKKSLHIQQRLNDGEFNDAALNLAELYHKMGDYKLMREYLEEAQKSYDPAYIYFDNPLIHLEILWGDYYVSQNVKYRALESYNKAYELIEEKKIDYLALDFYERYAQFLREQNYPDRAYEVQKRFMEYYKNQENLKAQETYQLAQAKFEAAEAKRERNQAKLQQEILDNDLQRKKTQSILLASIIVLMVLFLVYLFYSERLRLGLIKNLKFQNANLEKAKIRAEKSERAKTRFFSTLSHEMRTPLYGVTGMITIFENNPELKKYKDEISSLRFSADHLLEIINDLLDISKLEDDSFKLVKKSFNIKLLVEDVINSFDRNRLRNAQCTLTCDIDRNVPNYVVGDARRIKQVLLNIIGNAIKFTPKGEVCLRLTVKHLESGKHQVRFEVQDNGIGIPKEKQEAIFDEFSQLEELQLREAKGTGLGLPIVRKLLEKMGADIEVESEPGKGSTFSFELLLEEATLLQVTNTNSKKAPIPPKELPADFKGLRFLVVDDNKINRMVTNRILSNFKAEVQEASNGKEAIELVKNQDYDLILMDINMPGLNGYQTTQIIRDFELDVPIIALTASVENYVTRRALESGMNDVISKPFNTEKFFKTIHEQMARRSRAMH
ncbi:tetratricopeptide repeat-containing hybrid sensor histidine kinase/response regulator [Leeuwenhoekiella parthenopeia]|uniref:histidine kinase n=1 Tax=Leeuwenhoekiella parthenopeia TaxID=2890320 RepID=A0ABS8GQR4_9FLAO|nr:response regulator [Leeuwenhoekiella parthenopeia]MCC4212312.1 response regulator [Leeuwenhoekiella parthenopeia]